MKMSLNELEKALMKVGRQMPSDDSVPYAFEKRIMANLKAGRTSLEQIWTGAFIRAAGFSLAIALVLGIFLGPSSQPQDTAEDWVSKDLESVLVAGVPTVLEETW
jgi:hypothetical protein